MVNVVLYKYPNKLKRKLLFTTYEVFTFFNGHKVFDVKSPVCIDNDKAQLPIILLGAMHACLFTYVILFGDRN